MTQVVSEISTKQGGCIRTLLKFGVVALVVLVLQNEPPRRGEAQHINKEVVTQAKAETVNVTPTPVPALPVAPQELPPPKTNREIGQELAGGYGWTGQEWVCLERLWTGESGWNHLAYNQSSGATGIPQSLPGSKMASAGADYMTNPATQIKWGLSYISGRYGTPCNALSQWQARSPHWY